MLNWGIGLMAIGGFSFVLPLLNRQFILISLLGFTGVGSTVAGAVLFVAGALLFWLALKAENKANSPQPAQASETSIQEPDSEPPAALRNQVSGASSTNATQSTFPPNVVGNLIARSLDVSCKIEQISAQERELLKEANVTLARYRDEMLFLAGFAQDFAIATLLRESPSQGEVLRGYREAWSNLGAHSGAGRIKYERFLERCPVYAEAAKSIDSSSISPISLAFGQFLDAGNGKASMLALIVADAIFFSHIEGTKGALEKAHLLHVSASNA